VVNAIRGQCWLWSRRRITGENSVEAARPDGCQANGLPEDCGLGAEGALRS
jgi:hypothetical protein